MSSQNAVILEAVTALEKGGTLLYPTDTIWGIGCDATNATAVEKIYALKQRDHSKSMLVLCADVDMVSRYVSPVCDGIRDLLLCCERPTTVVMPLKTNLLAGNLTASDGTIGVRIPQMDFCRQMLQLFGKPVVSTSANLSGRPSPASFTDIDNALIQSVDYCVPRGYEESTGRSSSRIVKLSADGTIVVIRD